MNHLRVHLNGLNLKLRVKIFIFRCTIEKIRDDGVYLLENGMHMLFYVGLATNPAFIQVGVTR